jgi:hypothetical protein
VLCLVELRGFEPLTSCMPSQRTNHTTHHGTPPGHAALQVSRPVAGRVVRWRVVLRGAVSGKSPGRLRPTPPWQSGPASRSKAAKTLKVGQSVGVARPPRFMAPTPARRTPSWSSPVARSRNQARTSGSPGHPLPMVWTAAKRTPSWWSPARFAPRRTALLRFAP